VIPTFVKTSTARAALASGLLLLVSAAALLGFNGLSGAAPARAGLGHPAAQAATTTAAPAISATGTVTASGTPTETVDPFTLLHPFDFVPDGGELVKESVTDLGGGDPLEAMLTMSITGPQTDTTGTVVTTTVSTLEVLRYDKSSGEWKILWEPNPAVSGQAIALPDIRGTSADRYQAGDLLRTGQPILLLRTQAAGATPAAPPTVTLRLWAWTGDTAVPLRMTTSDGQQQEAVFTGTSDVQTADLDDDGVIEVIVDSGPATTIYRWDAAQTRFVVRK
jgi:hypothetical protein